jgi:tetratricopeptide (TPR) repeat protein
MLKICNSHHEKTAECYYHLALCYLKASRTEEAITHLNKAKTYFENYSKGGKIAYGAVCLKMGLLQLSQNKLQEALDCTNQALAIIETQQEG